MAPARKRGAIFIERERSRVVTIKRQNPRAVAGKYTKICNLKKNNVLSEISDVTRE
ncbi:hypothetical protein PATSB16_22610 [Pandoraea thiooxydans]|nr:hypothetical protein PATSB16_22610 [Pandoraea thiooxydans]